MQIDLGLQSPNGYFSDFMQSRAYEPCWWCGERPTSQWHHVLFRRKKGMPELNHIYNLAPLCEPCHMSGEVNTYDARRKWWRYITETFGAVEVMNWFISLPLKFKERMFD